MRWLQRAEFASRQDLHRRHEEWQGIDPRRLEDCPSVQQLAADIQLSHSPDHDGYVSNYEFLILEQSST